MQRQEARKGVRQAVKATILGHPEVTIPCEIIDFSRSGIGITVRQEIALGSAVKVDWDTHFLVGRVRRVSEEGGEHHVGLELLYCSKWEAIEAEPPVVA